MKQGAWPAQLDASRFSTVSSSEVNCFSDGDRFHYSKPTTTKAILRPSVSSTRHVRLRPKTASIASASITKSLSVGNHDFSSLPYDVLLKIGVSFSPTTLLAASLVCRSWGEALKPLREAVWFFRLGKRYKHGRGGVQRDIVKALDLFMKSAACGCTMAMVDAGLMYWEMGNKEKAVALYRNAAELGDPSGQCNLGISCLQVEPLNAREAVKWLHKASCAGNVRAQYQLALCLHQGRGVDSSINEAAKWYLRAAEGGYVRAMYNVSLCYSSGEGLLRSHQLARKWMKRAADCGHHKAQFEHGLTLFSESDLMKALVYLELASRAGETAATRVRDVILGQLSEASRDHAMFLVDNWRALPSSR